MAGFGKIFCLSVMLMLTKDICADTPKTYKETVEEVQTYEQYIRPILDATGVYLAEHFDDEVAFKQRWVQSQVNAQSADKKNYDGKWEIQTPIKKLFKNDLGLVLVSEGKHAAISTLLDKPFHIKDKPLIVQYEVTMQEGQKCGGAYIKLLSHGFETKADLLEFYDQSPYMIMFGPDKCGNSNDLHFIYRYKSTQANEAVEKKYSKKISRGLDFYNDKESHMYTLIIRPNNTYTIMIDNKLVVHESAFLEEFAPQGDRPFQMAPIYAAGFGVWALTPMLLFDNVLVTEDPTLAQQWAEQTFSLKRAKISKDSGLDEGIQDYPPIYQTETDGDGKREPQINILNKSIIVDFKTLMFKLFSADEGSLRSLGCGLEHLYGDSFAYIGFALLPFTFMWITMTYLYRRYEPDSVPRIEKNKVEAEDYPHHSEVEADAEVEAEFNTDDKQMITDKVTSENLNREAITNGDKVLSDEPEQEQTVPSASPWLYAGLVLGSCISVGVVTYMWFGNKSVKDAKEKEADAVVEDDSCQSNVKIEGNDKDRRKQSVLSESNKVLFEIPEPELEIKNTNNLVENNSECSTKFRDVEHLRGDESSVVNRSGKL